MKKLSALILVIIVISVFFVWSGFSPADPDLTDTTVFTVSKGQGAGQIAGNLKQAGLIKSALSFEIVAHFSGLANRLKAGDYKLSPSITVSEIISKMSEGRTDNKKVTIVPGWDLTDLGNYLEAEGIAILEEVLELDNKEKETGYFSRHFPFMADKPSRSGLEGYLFADTYEILNEDSLEDIFFKALKNFEAVFDDGLKRKIEERGLSIYQTVTLASMLEKEVITFEDKKMVAGVLANRLKAGMPLQVDATITYITKKNSTRVPASDLGIDSVYNTYIYRGLPFGPISTPGRESIEAALNPTPNNYFFYLSTKDGETIFSRNLAEHNLAISKYLR